MAVRLEEKSSLALVDFLCQNSNCVEKRTSDGNTALHYSVLHHRPESLKLLLKAKAALHTVNGAGETALDLARRLQHTHCVELLELAQSGKFNSQIHVEFEWESQSQELYDSEDDLDERVSPLPRSHCCPVVGEGNTFACWNVPHTNANPRPCQTYENLDFLYNNHPANSALNGGDMPPPPLPVKSIQRGRSDPQISVSSQDSTHSNKRSSSSTKRSSSPQSQPRHSPTLSGNQGGGVLGSPQGHGRGGRISGSPPSQGGGEKAPTTTVHNHKGPISSEKTTSYRRTSSVGPVQSKILSPSAAGAQSPSAVGSQEELYCSLLQSSPPAPSSNPSVLNPASRPRRNAMVSVTRPHHKRVRALVDCRASSSEQLAFYKDEIIIVTASSDLHWWVGHIEGDPSRSGTFPVNYVHKLT